VVTHGCVPLSAYTVIPTWKATKIERDFKLRHYPLREDLISPKNIEVSLSPALTTSLDARSAVVLYLGRSFLAQANSFQILGSAYPRLPRQLRRARLDRETELLHEPNSVMVDVMMQPSASPRHKAMVAVKEESQPHALGTGRNTFRGWLALLSSGRHHVHHIFRGSWVRPTGWQRQRRFRTEGLPV
jgi:hypothetical protein